MKDARQFSEEHELESVSVVESSHMFDICLLLTRFETSTNKSKQHRRKFSFCIVSVAIPYKVGEHEIEAAKYKLGVGR